MIAPTMKFGIAKLPKTVYKNTEKQFKRKKKQTKNLTQSRIEKQTQTFVMMKEKVLLLCKISAVATGGLNPHFALLKILFQNII